MYWPRYWSTLRLTEYYRWRWLHLQKKPGDMENKAVVDMLEDASRVAARDV